MDYSDYANNADYSLSLEPHGMLCALRGAIQPQDLLSALKSISTHPHFDRFKYILFDLRQGHTAASELRPVEPFIAFTLGTSCSNPSMVICIVAAEQHLHTMIARYQATLGDRVHLFSSLQAARQHIGTH